MNKRRNALTALALVIIVLFAYLVTNGLPAKDADDGAAGLCSVTIECKCLVEDLELLPQEKRYLVPADGVLLTVSNIPYYEGESVFDVTRRAAQAAKLHMEFVDATAYATAYVEAFANIYEFDAGELSGWTFSVNGEHPTVGSSAVPMQDGDTVVWSYVIDRYED